MLRSTKVTIALVCLCIALSSCGQAKRETASSSANTLAKDRIIQAIEKERELDAQAKAMIESVRLKNLDLGACLDALTEQVRTLLRLIEEVSELKQPPSRELKECVNLLPDYLRNRVFQIEEALSATSGVDLEAKYLSWEQKLAALRKNIGDKLVTYSPDLERNLPF